MRIRLGNGTLRVGQRRRRGGGCALFFMAPIFLGFAAFFYFVILPSQQADLNVIREGFMADYAAYEAVPAGETISFSGTLTDNEPIFDDVVAIRRDELSEIRRQDSTEWQWHTVESNIPDLTVSVDGGVVQTTRRTAAKLDGPTIERLETATSGSYRYHGERIGDGSTRTYTLTDGDFVTIIGFKRDDNSVGIRDIYAGSPEDLEAQFAQTGRMLTIITYLFAGVGLLMPIGGVANILRGRFF